jgi:hypothetical protein
LAIAEHGRGPHHPDVTSPGTNGSNLTPSSDESAASLSPPPCGWPNLSKKEWIPLRRPNFPPRQYSGLIAIIVVLSNSRPRPRQASKPTTMGAQVTRKQKEPRSTRPCLSERK